MSNEIAAIEKKHQEITQDLFFFCFNIVSHFYVYHVILFLDYFECAFDVMRVCVYETYIYCIYTQICMYKDEGK